ncbi:ABC transporter permease [Rhodococcus sp. NPDC058505]|uniref:ABC transporter permease n=1 Tax=unclassified Rhodococcus (in: high G+C Gram-positive bacteria) TaxID=192944 RepID=UPI00365F8E71
MTAATLPAATDNHAVTGPSRIGSVLRLHTVAWPLLIAWPVGLLTVAFAISWMIYYLVGNEEGEGFTGSVTALAGFAIAFYVQALTQSFPFALGLSVTRREFYTATTLMAVAQSAIFAVAVWALSLVEAATDGWGVHMRMFGITRYFTDSPLVQLLCLFSILLLSTGVAMLAGAIYQRWRTTGLLAAGVALLVTLGLAAIVITWAEWWPAIGSWFVDTPRVMPMVVLPLVPAVLSIGFGWIALRRAAV